MESLEHFRMFSWFHNNTERQFHSDDRSILILSNVQEHHAGTYTCFASNLFGNASADIQMIVTSMFSVENICGKILDEIVIPKFTFQSDGYLNGIVEESLTLPCQHIGIPKPTIRWLKDDHVSQYKRYGISNELFV